MIRSKKISELADAHRQNSSRGSGCSDHYCCACDACWAHMSLLSFLSTTLRASRNFRRALRYESCELALKRLGYASTPAIANGLQHRVGKDILVAFFQTIEDAHRRALGRNLRNHEVAAHICF